MGKCKFLKEWLERKDSAGCKISAWGERRAENELFCRVCDKTISTAKGFNAIKQHFETQKHKSNYILKMGPDQLSLAYTNNIEDGQSSIKLISEKDATYAAELIWCLEMVAENNSANSCQNKAKIFQAMFPQESIAKGFALNPTKFRYLVCEALAPYFREMFLKEIRSECYTLQFDETTNNAGVKELQIMLRFWSSSCGEIVSHHLESFYMGHATAEDLKKNILSAIDNAHLTLSNLLMLGSDGPKVNQKVFRIINEEVKLIREKGLVNIGFCNLHVVNNAFQKGLDELGNDAADLIVFVHQYFKDLPSRWDDYRKIQKDKKLPDMQFIKHVNSRWLTIEPAAKRLLEQWDGIIEYFLKYVPMKEARLMKSCGYKRIVTYLKQKTIRAELKFICVSASVFTKFTKLFQKEEPLVHILYREIKELILTLMGRCCKNEAIEKFSRHPSDDAFQTKNLLPAGKMPLSDEMRSVVAPFSTLEKTEFLLQMQKHYVMAGNYLLGKNILNSLMKSFSCIHPENVNSNYSLKQLNAVASVLPVYCKEEKLIDEWKLIQLEKVSPKSNRIDHFWSEIFSLKSADSEVKYPNVSNVVKAILTLSHGSAEVERGFSRSGRILSEDRASMSIRTLNARLTISDGLKRFKNRPECVPITKDLICSARTAYRSYHNYLDEEKQKAEQKIQKAKEEEEVKIAKEEKLKEFEKNKVTIENLKTELKEARSAEVIQASANNQLLEEASKMLNKAINNNDFASAKVAQTMLEGLMKSNEEHNRKRKSINNLEKQIEKKRDSVITSFFQKRPKTDTCI